MVEADGKVQHNNFTMSDSFLDIDEFICGTVDNSSLPESDGMWISAHGFKDFKEEFDFKVRSRWRRPSFITGLFEDYVPTTNRIVSMAMGSAENILEYDSGLSMDQATNYHASTALSADTSGLIDDRAVLLEDNIPSTGTIVGMVIPDNDMKEGLESSVSVHHTFPYQSTMAIYNHDYVPTSNRIASMKMGSAGNILEYDSGLSMGQAVNYHASAAVSTTKFTHNFAVKTSSNVASASLTKHKKSHTHYKNSHSAFMTFQSFISDDSLIYHEVNWGVLVFFIDGVLIPSQSLHLLTQRYAHDNQLHHYFYVPLLAGFGDLLLLMVASTGVISIHGNVQGNSLDVKIFWDCLWLCLSQLLLAPHCLFMCSHFLSLGTALFQPANTIVARLLDFMVIGSLTVKNYNHMVVLSLAGTSARTARDHFPCASGFCPSVTLIHSMDWGVTMSSCDGIILHDRRWHSLAHQLGFNNQLIDVWGDFLPSTLHLLTIAFRLGKGIIIWRRLEDRI